MSEYTDRFTRLYSGRKYASQNHKVQCFPLGQTSKACQIESHGACQGFARQRRKCKCGCHTVTQESQP